MEAGRVTWLLLLTVCGGSREVLLVFGFLGKEGLLSLTWVGAYIKRDADFHIVLKDLSENFQRIVEEKDVLTHPLVQSYLLAM
ncbi:hypothetical protein CEXT_212161 [Caerostris extrusa]|uniref:Uncharacterized protein n=1 Tax=Caerostris extrusa TaxID=172846 RepID=A0AAV4ND80_CAEEX|nr:hypothetical protein CEXT_212161 [Caerostris extrusa]